MAMHPLSDHASRIVERMEPDRRYGAQDLLAFIPEINIERLREIMHELWIARQVERVDHGSWRRHRSAPPHAPQNNSGEVELVKPEELFDHATFAAFFK